MRTNFVVLLLISAALLSACSKENNTVYEPEIAKIEPPAPCPWRDAQQDMTNWFPTATRHFAHDIILSGKRAALQQKLGRPLLPEEMAVHVYFVTSNHLHLGTVLTRRIKGDHGAIELAVAINTNRALEHLKVQRIREPEAVTSELAQLTFTEDMKHLKATDALPNLKLDTASPAARKIVEDIVKTARDTLILFEEAHDEVVPPHHH